MMSASFLNNVVPWALQVLIIGTVGAALPMIFRIRHPRSQLIYCHLLLAACLVLPFVQPWHHPVIAASAVQKAVESAGVPYSSARIVLNPQTAPASLNQMVLWILAAGMALRLCWILLGLRQLRRYRNEAAPLYPIPQSIRTARSLVHSLGRADAEFATTATGAGPLTFGFFRRLVLVPPSFLQLDEDAQVGIACHELLHVRRNDWLMTLVDELVGSVLWFNPGIWWVLAQTRLAREQLGARALRQRSAYDCGGEADARSCSGSIVSAQAALASAHAFPSHGGPNVQIQIVLVLCFDGRDPGACRRGRVHFFPVGRTSGSEARGSTASSDAGTGARARFRGESSTS
jgi:beta-lactamase regulating signal transducer with metallopeptidase domain